MTLYYSLVSNNLGYKRIQLTTGNTGLHPVGVRDGSLYEPDRPHALHLEAKALHFPIGEPNRSKDAILVEGKMSTRLSSASH